MRHLYWKIVLSLVADVLELILRRVAKAWEIMHEFL